MGNPLGTFESHGKRTLNRVALSTEQAELLGTQGTPRAPQVRLEQLAITHTPCDSHTLSSSEGGFSLLSSFPVPEDISGLTLEAPTYNHTRARARASRGVPAGLVRGCLTPALD